MKWKLILVVAMRLALGSVMMKGGIDKFQKEMPTTVEVVEKAQKFTSPEMHLTLQKILYISGMKQTGYAWEVLGIFELFFGLLLVLQKPGVIVSLLLLPITFQILLFHIFLDYNIVELIETSLLFGINIILVLHDWQKIKVLFFSEINFSSRKIS